MVITNVNQVVYDGNGSNTAFPFTFQITDYSEIRLQLVYADGTVTDITSDFYVDTVTNTVYYPGYAPGAEPPEAEQPPKVATGQQLVVYRDVPMTQEVNLGTSWPFTEIEYGLDKLTMICQQIYSYTNRKLDAALNEMFQLAGIVTDSEKLQHITDQYNAIDTNVATASAKATAAANSATAAANSATAAANSATSASTSATNAATSYTNANTVATALTDIYNDAIAQGVVVAPAVDATLSVAGAAADAKTTGDFINNTSNGSVFEWELGTLTPGTGAEQTGTTRIRSKYIVVSPGTKITLSSPTSRLLVYCFGSAKEYISDSTWLGSNEFTISNPSVRYVRILIRKDTSNSTISSEEIGTLAQGLTIAYVLPIETYTEVYEIPKHAEALSGNRYIDVEVGSVSAGTPYPDTAYVRSRDFVFANKGDVFTVSPVGFGLYYGAIYLYTTNNAQGYTSSVTIPTVTTGKTWSYTFTQDCFFKFRASNASSSAYITLADLVGFSKTFHIGHMYSADELIDKIKPFDIDYDTINTSIQGKFNLAIQTDTHMSKFVGFTSAQYNADNFDDLRSVVQTVNSLYIDVFANLGDLIRGYQCDTDYESRATADAILDCYKKIKTYKAIVIGNHDDGNMYYYDTTYNDKQSIQQVMFPSEQFNRCTKFGINNKGTSNYYYEDINGVRVITLYQRDFNYSENVPGIEAFKIGSTQIAWFTNTALDTNLPVIVLTHAPLLNSLYATSRAGFDDILSALTTFVTNGGTVIAVLSGHTHAQNTAKVDGINHIVFKNGYKQFELVSVDLVNRTISCKAYNDSAADLSLTF